jgi:glycerol-3-phosphate dehydrogenase (NAD(P)+)
MTAKPRCNKQGQPYELRRIGVVGGGAWGCALAQTLRRAGRETLIWAYEPETVDEINTNHTNRVYLPGISLDSSIQATAKASQIADSDALLLAVPAQFMRSVVGELAPHWASGKPVVVCTKGLEENTGKLMTDVVAGLLPQTGLAVLTGPSFAGEVARNLPVALTLACADESLGRALTLAIGHRSFRLYWTDDVLGAQIGGAVKNVLAIAAGIAEGSQFGSSAHAAITTRGFAEFVRLGLRLGAKLETMTGLSGLGDLILTCSSPQSRNMSLGQALGQGKSLAQVLGSRKSVTEGVHSAQAVVELAKLHGVEMPICEAVYGVLQGQATVRQAIDMVLSRPFRPEAGYPAMASHMLV